MDFYAVDCFFLATVMSVPQRCIGNLTYWPPLYRLIPESSWKRPVPVRDILLQMTSYPERTPQWALDFAHFVANQFDARLSSILCHIRTPKVSNWQADKLTGVSDIIKQNNARSRQNARKLMEEFSALVDEQRRGDQVLVDCNLAVRPREVAKRARFYDLTIVPVHVEVEYAPIAEATVFESGRPMLLLPKTDSESEQINSVAIGWDGSRAAARALADALPFCAMAETVSLLQVTGEKEIGSSGSLSDIQRHLETHGIKSEISKVPAEGRDAGSALMDHCSKNEVDMLVIGAFGHSRFREFLFGGATRSVIDDPHLPVLMSH